MSDFNFDKTQSKNSYNTSVITDKYENEKVSYLRVRNRNGAYSPEEKEIAMHQEAFSKIGERLIVNYDSENKAVQLIPDETDGYKVIRQKHGRVAYILSRRMKHIENGMYHPVEGEDNIWQKKDDLPPVQEKPFKLKKDKSE